MSRNGSAKPRGSAGTLLGDRLARWRRDWHPARPCPGCLSEQEPPQPTWKAGPGPNREMPRGTALPPLQPNTAWGLCPFTRMGRVPSKKPSHLRACPAARQLLPQTQGPVCCATPAGLPAPVFRAWLRPPEGSWDGGLRRACVDTKVQPPHTLRPGASRKKHEESGMMRDQQLVGWALPSPSA